MNFTDAISSCFHKYVTFSGRATRSEYWFFALFCFIVGLILGFIDAAVFIKIDPMTGRPSTGPLGAIWSLATFLPSLSVAIRRLHDINKSGWWFLLCFIPIVGWIILLVWYCTKGTAGDNRFGGDPLAQLPASA